MATTTQNLGLIKPAGTDKIRIAQINSNMDIIDEKMGPVGSTPLQTQATNAASSISALQSSTAVICNGNTHAAIASGQYAYVRNHSSLAEGLYTATTAIAANAALSASNLTASPNALNTLLNKINALSLIRSVVGANNQADFETVLSTVCSSLSYSEFCFIEVYCNWSGSFTAGSRSLAIIYRQNISGNLFNCFILMGGAQGYYYSGAWHWQQPTQNNI